ncbi:cobalamin biosynthesis protein CobG [Janibacter sp. UYMM211]|uniref:cobalamin biosynthesis protein CobG n=1 Tax=Janibacter sp. UYMM211 TaxID=3156342 RepID=UPI003392E593
MTTRSPARDGADRCPGLLSPFVSADGAMVRLRVPGGRVAAADLVEISSLAGRFGDPDVTLTSRGSLQLRGLPSPLPRELVTAIGALGLVPSAAHDKARNVVADPAPALDDLVRALDEALLADDALAALPGRFLLAVAAPGGAVLGEPWDVAVVDEGAIARVLVDGRALVVPRADAATTVLDVARRFLAVRGGERVWNVRDLTAEDRAALLPGGSPFVVDVGPPPPAGPLGEDLVVLVPLGLLTPAMAAALAGTATAAAGGLTPPLRITPWRSALVPGGAARARELAAAGLVVSPGSPWAVLTACAGAPACARTRTPTRELARAAAPLVDPFGPPVHVIGCDRACGHPARPHTTALDPTCADDVVRAQRRTPEEPT